MNYHNRVMVENRTLIVFANIISNTIRILLLFTNQKKNLQKSMKNCKIAIKNGRD